MAEKKAPGDPLKIPASAYNEFVDAAAAHKRALLASTPGNSRGLGKESGIVKIKNVGSTDLNQFEILGITDSLFDPENADQLSEFKRNPVTLKGTRPNCDHVGKFVVLLEPAQEDVIARAVISGVVQVQLQVDDEDHTYADITPADASKLTTVDGEGSAQIIWKPAGTGLKWAVVRISNSLSADSCVSTSTTEPPSSSTSSDTTDTTTTEPPSTTTDTTEPPSTTTGTTDTTTTEESSSSSSTTTGTTDEPGTTSSTTTPEPGTTSSTTTTEDPSTTTDTTEPPPGTTTSTTEEPPGSSSTTTSTTEEPPSTTTGTTGTETTEVPCPPFACSGDCDVSFEVVTDVRCVDGTIEVDKATICLSTSQLDVDTLEIPSGTTAGA